MKLYADYIKEVYDRDCYFDEYCFVTYKKYPETKSISLIDYYCAPEKRGQGYMVNLMDEFIKTQHKEGYNTFYGCTDTEYKGWERSQKIMLNYGFKYIKTEDSTYKHFMLKLEENK